MRLYIQYLESERSKADKSISLNANWNDNHICLDRNDFIPIVECNQPISDGFSNCRAHQASAIIWTACDSHAGLDSPDPSRKGATQECRHPDFPIFKEIMNMKNKPVIDLSDCILCGICQDVCPEVFKLNDVGYIEVAENQDYERPCVDEAIKNCPADCIAWE